MPLSYHPCAARFDTYNMRLPHQTCAVIPELFGFGIGKNVSILIRVFTSKFIFLCSAKNQIKKNCVKTNSHFYGFVFIIGDTTMIKESIGLMGTRAFYTVGTVENRIV